MVFRQRELHCAQGNTIHTSFSLIKAGSRYNWWAGAMIATYDATDRDMLQLFRGSLWEQSQKRTCRYLLRVQVIAATHIQFYSLHQIGIPSPRALSRATKSSPGKFPSGQLSITLFPDTEIILSFPAR